MASKKLTEVAGARCGLCRLDAIKLGENELLFRCATCYVCSRCMRRCKELVAICPVNGVLKFSEREPK